MRFRITMKFHTAKLKSNPVVLFKPYASILLLLYYILNKSCGKIQAYATSPENGIRYTTKERCQE